MLALQAPTAWDCTVQAAAKASRAHHPLSYASPATSTPPLLTHPQNTPLDWDAVLRSEIPLKVVASSLTTLRAEAFGSFTSKQDLVECLKASANVPEIVGPPRRHRGHELVDAAVFEPIPVKAALRDGCTHVLALCSRPPDAGPAWGRVLRRAVHNAVKYTVLNPVSLRARVCLPGFACRLLLPPVVLSFTCHKSKQRCPHYTRCLVPDSRHLYAWHATSHCGLPAMSGACPC